MADRSFQQGINNIYNYNLGFSLRKIYRKHHHLFEAAAAAGEKGALDWVWMLRAACTKDLFEAAAARGEEGALGWVWAYRAATITATCSKRRWGWGRRVHARRSLALNGEHLASCMGASQGQWLGHAETWW